MKDIANTTVFESLYRLSIVFWVVFMVFVIAECNGKKEQPKPASEDMQVDSLKTNPSKITSKN